MTVVVVDYGVGNLGSIPNMLARLGERAVVTRDPAAIVDAERVILPGVGAFDAAMRRLAELDLVDSLHAVRAEGRARILGLCLGMQLLFESSEEGRLPGLGWLPGHVVRFRFPADQSLPVPHMGWNDVEVVAGTPMEADLAGSRFYFAHSFYAVPEDAADVVAHTHYGVPFASIVARGQVMGAQFHPEKSHRFGLGFLESFLRAA